MYNKFVVKRKANKRSLNIFKILSIVLILLFIIFIPILIQKLIKINKIECSSQYDACPFDIETKLKTFEQKDYKKVKKEVTKVLVESYLIRDFSMQYRFPSKLIIELNLKKPKYTIKDSLSSKFYLIDEDETVLEITEESNLPTIVKSRVDIKLGENINKKDKFSLEIVEKVAWLYSVKEGIIEKEELKLTLKEGVLVRFPLEGDVDSLVGGLRLIFSRLNDGSQGIRMEDIKEIDLRFKNPVLR
ncbi:hypothetical protein A2422_02065 [Candidatus Woesebacteria bacterium RIFOXYC1_FULL_31_51]|uniref:POTRA domain-containing protein n=1 Tax=Candidatus Woesebacteria bacterium GW2011_GWC2_31_9 TaxID=1618586 RepID=A0A0G0AWM0_9BACT|nr:MAG: hypothetical protein UR17_C0001G0872 [Candidatus Woesebacteria bacterium GW2011_GWF1_31_35]KKP23586.1 MAG: hypothetical protein UR11_C0001G0560 [Candidatus Woesebacteria bacterium GW2011_GWC1_30_29]KKP27033.1 MAG: hypothetical protein UR13_C0001G0128 [Candidatus Woesebacteria bacterium GW2011_GWD1_31_12]KKP27861.1 MAG: hypothetical protein UR16_C0002G0191 [Candidatus Woesebacteria bacterium GW2011_GWB1_31_29]KKP31010.1 MAG: hypothetical protein UR21_C0018G0001 [Candidatus Woesebacteria 